MSDKKQAAPLGDEISPEEIQDLLEDDGYSANQRKAWLKEVLTELQDDKIKPRSGDREQLIREVKNILSDRQDTPPISDDTL